MNPDVLDAIPRLVERGILPAEKAPLFLRAARRELVSVRLELRLLLYLGVLLVTGGAGLLVKENLDRIGPVAIAAGLGLAAAAALAWVWRTAPPFSWERSWERSQEQVSSPNLASDYLLLLGVLLAAADLAYVEARFTPLGPNWPWHLLLVSLFAAALAVRFDSRVVFSLALATFAAWRGVSVAHFGAGLLDTRDDLVRWNAIGCGVLFVVLGLVLARADRKAHFEPAAVHLGCLLVLGGLASGLGDRGWAGWAAALMLVGAGLAAWGYGTRRFPLFAYGVLGGYLGLTRFVFEGVEALGCFWIAFTSILMILGLVAVQRRMRSRGEA
jgi:hypothetical protein